MRVEFFVDYVKGQNAKVFKFKKLVNNEMVLQTLFVEGKDKTARFCKDYGHLLFTLAGRW